jgi:hypothetical protein
MPPQPFNPGDPIESNFLTVLSSGEGNALYEGYGGTDLSGYPQDQYGFPIWPGVQDASTKWRPTHAAGFFQFEPKTFDDIAAANPGINFGSLQGQEQAAWILAQQKFTANTDGGDLYTALEQGNYAQIQTALVKTWPSVKNDNFATIGVPLPNSTSTTPQSGQVITGIPWVDNLLNGALGTAADAADAPAAAATGALGGNTSSATNGPMTNSAAAIGASIGSSVAAAVAAANPFTPVIAWFEAHWIEAIVIAGVVVLIFVSFGGLFHTEGGNTKIVPIPV